MSNEAKEFLTGCVYVIVGAAALGLAICAMMIPVTLVGHALGM